MFDVVLQETTPCKPYINDVGPVEYNSVYDVVYWNLFMPFFGVY